MQMPEPDLAIIGRREKIAAALRSIVPGEGVITETDSMRVYETDGLSAYRQLPMIVVLPETTQQVADILRYCKEEGVKVVPRGAGTGLSGGALPLADGVLLGLGKFNRILEIDYDNRAVVTLTPCRMTASITRRIRPARSPVRSVAISRRIPVACTA